MWQHVSHFILRPIEALLGLFFVLSAIALYPGEEGKIQSKFEDFWISVDDYQKMALSRHTTFMVEVANIETRFLDRLFGQRLFSVQLLCVSFFCSVGVPSLLAFIYEDKFHHLNRPSLGFQVLGISISSFVVAFAAVVFRRNKVLRRTAYIAAFLFLSFWAKYTFPVYAHPHRSMQAALSLIAAEMAMTLLVLMPMSIGIAFDMGFIVVTRVMLRSAGQMASSTRVVTVIVANCLLALLLESPLLIIVDLYMEGKLPSEHSATGNFAFFLNLATFSSLGNAFDVCLALLFVLLALMLLLHRFVWPLLTRSVFKMQDIGTKGRRAILATLGTALLGSSMFGGKFPELLQQLIQRLGG
jgi:hypothetical protein